MRLITTNLTYNDVKPKLRELVDNLFKQVKLMCSCADLVLRDVVRNQDARVLAWALQADEVDEAELFRRANAADPSPDSRCVVGMVLVCCFFMVNPLLLLLLLFVIAVVLPYMFDVPGPSHCCLYDKLTHFGFGYLPAGVLGLLPAIGNQRWRWR